jgi:hypothetical protein
VRPVAEVIVVYDVSCPNCSRIARELPDLLRVPVKVRSCRDPQLPTVYPTLPPQVRTCATPVLGTIGRDGSVRWWPGLTGALGVLPVVRARGLFEAVGMLRTAWRAARSRRGAPS